MIGSALSIALITSLSLMSGMRWLRVAQREHYLPGSVTRMRMVWVSSSRINMIEPLLLAAAVIGWIAGPASISYVLGFAAMAIFPRGLSHWGRTSVLAWTARLKRLTALAVLLYAISSAVIYSLISALWGRAGVESYAIASLLAFYTCLDLALWLAAPLERRLSQKFVDRAASVLARVDPTVVGITGSYGKTSTKWYVHHLVDGARRVTASPASFNNRLGLARAVNEHLTPDAEVFIAEMGAYGRGEIAEICTWLRPSIAVITAIGPVHLQRFRTEERIVQAKSELIEPAEAVVLNVDHPALEKLADETERAGRRVWRCGSTRRAADVRVSERRGRVAVYIRGRRAGELSVSGVFTSNLACAAAAALELGVPAARIMERAERLAPAEHRQSIITSEKGFSIIDDTFNSNPAGAAKALEVLSRQGAAGARRVVVTPGMVEMGPRQRRENVRFAAAAAEVADCLVIVGRTNRRALLEGAARGDASVITVRSREEAVVWVRTNLGPGDAVLYENDLPDHYP